MLAELFIENLAVIEKASISLQPGLNVFTGETGAGKSIVIDAINAVLGQRASRELVRHGMPKAVVTARFTDIPEAAARQFDECGCPPEDGELVILREIGADGKSTARVNGRPISVGLLRELGAELVNIHGQHDNQVLLAPERHIDILDQYGGYEPLLEEYHLCYKNVLRIKKELSRSSFSEQEKARKIDLLTYQKNEIAEAAPVPGEDEELELKRQKIKNAEKIAGSLRGAHAALYGNEGEGGAVELTRFATQELSRAADFYEGAGELYSRLDSVGAELDSLTDELSDLLEDFHFSEGELAEVEDRLDELKSLKHKYGGTIPAVLDFEREAGEELAAMELSDQRIQELNGEATAEYSRLLKLAETVTQARRAASDRFAAAVTEELAFLDMPFVRLEVDFQQSKPNSRGRDGIEFLISANVGEPPKPIAKIASGGELSRIMLAIKNTLADKDEIPTLIFDEVDTGVSGRAAQKIGLKLRQAAQHRQILSVTHLAQIAALAEHHYLIQKQNDGERTYTRVERLDDEGRVREVARIMGTDTLTELTFKNAREMIENGRSENK